MSGMPNKETLTQGEFYTIFLLQIAATIIFLYVGYKRFREGFKEGRKSESEKSDD
jgi:hypothetical protein